MVNIATDVLVDILQRLPWATRRRLRLVCRSWRDLIHQRTRQVQQCQEPAVPLVVTTESAYLLPDVESSSKTCIPRKVWPSRMVAYERMEVVGVCGGVLCLCDGTKPGGAITLVNPATGDVLELPPLPRTGLFRRHNTRCSSRSWQQAYNFGYNHGRGQYKVVHVPCFFKSKDMVHVFTLGEASWKEVSAPAYARCKLDTSGVVSINGASYWVAEGSEDRIMSFDLESEQVTCTKPLPMSARPIHHLAQVDRRLSVVTATTTYRYGCGYIEVWILEIRRKEQIWIHQYSLGLSATAQQMVQPYFIHGKYVLVDRGNKLVIYQQTPTNYYSGKSECTAVHDNTCYKKLEASGMKGNICQTFAYIKTKKALSVYRHW